MIMMLIYCGLWLGSLFFSVVWTVVIVMNTIIIKIQVGGVDANEALIIGLLFSIKPFTVCTLFLKIPYFFFIISLLIAPTHCNIYRAITIMTRISFHTIKIPEWNIISARRWGRSRKNLIADECCTWKSCENSQKLIVLFFRVYFILFFCIMLYAFVASGRFYCMFVSHVTESMYYKRWK